MAGGFFTRLASALSNARVAAKPYAEQGVSGFAAYGGYVVTPETNAELLGANRWHTASDILTNISIVAASVRYSLNLISNPTWRADPPSDKPEAKAMAEFVEEVINGADTSWTRIIRRSAIYRFHGFNLQEWVAKKRDDGKIGIASVEPRPCHTIRKWDLDENGGILGVVQGSPQTGQELYLPRAKLVYLVDDSLTDRPEGMGWFRHLADPAQRLRRYLKLETMGFERDLAGIPVGRAPMQRIKQMVAEGKLDAKRAEKMIDDMDAFVRMQAKEPSTGLVFDSEPFLNRGGDGSVTVSNVMQWDMELLTGSATSVAALGEAIHRLTMDMALIMGTDSLLIGGRGQGSRALSEDKSRNLYLTSNAALNDMAEAYDRDIVTPIWSMNGFPDELRPKLKTEDVSFKDAVSIAQALADMAAAGAILAPDDPAINDLRDLLGISPAPPPSAAQLALARNPPVPGAGPGGGGADQPGRPSRENPGGSEPPNPSGGGGPARKAFNPDEPRDDYGRWADGSSPADFQKWFKGSKVVDGNGDPLIVYRGDLPGGPFSRTENSRVEGNFIFSDNPTIAQYYAPTRHEFGDGSYTLTRNQDPLSLNQSDGFYRANLAIKNPLVIDAKGESWLEMPVPRSMKDEFVGGVGQIDDIAATARKRGYDGLIVHDVLDQYGPGTQYYAFNRDQVRFLKPVAKFDQNEPRDDHGRWTTGMPGQHLSREQLDAAYATLSGAKWQHFHDPHTQADLNAQTEQLDDPLDHVQWERPGDFAPWQGVNKFNPNHVPSGPDGGRFTSATNVDGPAGLSDYLHGLANDPQHHPNVEGLKVSDTPIFHPEKSAMIRREDMPQIPDSHREAFLATVPNRMEMANPHELFPTQDQLDGYKVGLFVSDPSIQFQAPLVSKDNYVVDGHHHWGSAVAKSVIRGSTQPSIPIHRVDLNRDELLSRAHAYASQHGFANEPLWKFSADEPRDYHGRWSSEGGVAAAQGFGLVGPDGKITDKGMQTLSRNWIEGFWEHYQDAARSVVNGQTAEEYAAADPFRDANTEMARHALVAAAMEKINSSPPLSYPLYRGLVGVDYKVGDTFSESLTTWTSKESLARDFAHDSFGTAGFGSAAAGGGIFKVVGSDMHGINISDINPERAFENELVATAEEHLTSGQYRVTNVTTTGRGRAATRVYEVTRIGNAQQSDLKKVVEKFSPSQPRDYHGRWTSEGGGGPAVLFEVSPNPDNKQLMVQWGKLSDGEKQRITDKLARQYTPIVLDSLGVQGRVEPAFGGFEGEVNPSLYMNVNERPFDVAGAVGDTFGQKAMVVMSTEPGAGLSPVGMISIHAPGADEGKLRELQGKIGSLADGFTYHNGRMQILNFSGQSDEAFAAKVDAALGGNYMIQHGTVYSAYIEEKNYARPEGDSAGAAWGQVRGHVRAAFSQSLAQELRRKATG